MRRLLGGGGGSSGPVDWLIAGLGNPGERYARTPHNVGFAVADELARRWELPKPKQRYAGRYTDGRTGPGGPRVAILWPQTYMNEAGRSVGPARGALHLDLDRVLVVHDEIDLRFGDVRSRVGGGLVLRAHRGPDLLAVDRHRARRVHAEADRVAGDLHDLDRDVVAEDDLLTGPPGHHEHRGSSLDSVVVRLARRWEVSPPAVRRAAPAPARRRLR
jgi:hypothetical protein